MSIFQKFDPSNEKHVRWLKEFVESDLDAKQNILKKNPMGSEIPPFEIVQVMFGLCAAYTKAVFKGTAHHLLQASSPENPHTSP